MLPAMVPSQLPFATLFFLSLFSGLSNANALAEIRVRPAMPAAIIDLFKLCLSINQVVLCRIGWTTQLIDALQLGEAVATAIRTGSVIIACWRRKNLISAGKSLMQNNTLI